MCFWLLKIEKVSDKLNLWQNLLVEIVKLFGGQIVIKIKEILYYPKISICFTISDLLLNFNCFQFVCRIQFVGVFWVLFYSNKQIISHVTHMPTASSSWVRPMNQSRHRKQINSQYIHSCVVKAQQNKSRTNYFSTG